MADTKLFKEFYLGEMNGALIYDTLAELEKDERLAEVYRRIAATERDHAETWQKKLLADGAQAPEFRPIWKTRLLIWLAKRFGPNVILSTIQDMERDGSAGYAGQPGAEHMASQEHSHDFLMNQISQSVTGGLEGGVLAQLEGRHRTAGGNALRAAVLGANDGLVSNMSLVMGVAGALMDNRAILIAGLAGMLAGSISMALGEWLSVQSSRELYQHQIKLETAEIENAPEEEAEELALIYEARGLKPEMARQLADQILSDKASATETLAREELGIDPGELGGSAWEAALTSFFLFTLGAIIPVAPFAFFTGMTAVAVSIGLSVIGLFLLGAVITLFTARSVLFSGLRMVTFGLLAAGVTFGIGRLIGMSIGG